MLLIAVKVIDENYNWKLLKYILTDDDYDYGSQCDDSTNLIVISELRNSEIEDIRKKR